MTIFRKTFIYRKIFKYTFWFWMAETLFFIVRDGWHFRAVHGAEKICDSIVGFGLVIGFFFFFSVLDDMVNIYGIYALHHKDGSRFRGILNRGGEK